MYYSLIRCTTVYYSVPSTHRSIHCNTILLSPSDPKLNCSEQACTKPWVAFYLYWAYSADCKAQHIQGFMHWPHSSQHFSPLHRSCSHQPATACSVKKCTTNFTIQCTALSKNEPNFTSLNWQFRTTVLHTSFTLHAFVSTDSMYYIAYVCLLLGCVFVHKKRMCPMLSSLAQKLYARFMCPKSLLCLKRGSALRSAYRMYIVHTPQMQKIKDVFTVPLIQSLSRLLLVCLSVTVQ